MSDTPDLNAILDRELSGVDDEVTPNDVAAEVAAEVAPAAEPAAPSETAEAAGAPEPVVPPEFKAEWDKRNRENQQLRERAKQYEQVYGRAPKENVEVLLAVSDALIDGRFGEVRDWLANQEPEAQQAAEKVVAAAEEATGVAVPDAPAPPPGLTREELLKILDERDQKNKNEAWLGDFNAKAKEMGYDPDDADYIALTWAAANKTNTDIVEADKRVRERMMARFGADPEFKQRIIDEYIAEKAGQGDSTLPGTASAPAPEGREAPKSLKEADSQLKAWLKEQDLSGPNDRFR